jgi:hypothetical protein
MRRTRAGRAPEIQRPSSLVAQRLDRVEARRAPRRIERGEKRKSERHHDDGGGPAGVIYDPEEPGARMRGALRIEELTAVNA